MYSSDVDKGKELSVSCAACHGDNGISVNPVWPKLAGQNPKYLASQLYEFRKGADGNRNNAVMYGIAVTLSDSDIEDLSAYYASLKSNVGLTQDKYLELGRDMYRGGNMDIKNRHASVVMVLTVKETMLLLYQCYLVNILNILINS